MPDLVKRVLVVNIGIERNKLMNTSIVIRWGVVAFLLATGLHALPSRAGLINVALDKPAAASSHINGGEPWRAVDGYTASIWSSGGFASPSAPHWWIVDLGEEFEVESIVLYSLSSTQYSGFTNIYKAYRSLDNTEWIEVASGTLIDTNDPRHEWPLESLPARYFKYEVVGGTHWAHLAEFEAYVIPEPTSLALLLIGAGGVVLFRRKRIY